MTNKYLLEFYLPAAQESYDIRIPADIPLNRISDLIVHALNRMSGGLYAEASIPCFCVHETGEILNINMTADKLGLKNGSKLMLI